TFGDIIKDKCEVEDPVITLEEVALFNWGTKEPKEIVRALVELVGCSKVDDDPAKCQMDVTKGPGGGKILLPKLWKKEGLSYETIHTLKVKTTLPATAIAITSLDKWFLPADETCEVGYALEGLHSRALKVDMEVYASNYAKATATNAGEFVTYAYTDLPETPILKKSLSADAGERSTGSETSWKGESEATEGILKPRGTAKRYINAASSPYEVMLRYYKKDDHKKAILRIESFWPRWENTPRTLVDDSLKFKYKLKDCPSPMNGQFQIFDKDDKIIWRQALTPAECANGEHTHDWAEGKPLVTEAKMPYRVQIQVHTNKDTDPGMGLASMHTEVRLFTHPDIGTHGVDHELEKQVLTFEIAPFYNAKTAPVDDSAKGRKLRLAKAGYHPGPIEDGEAQAPYLQAVKEFQRDHAVDGIIVIKDAVRLKADGTINDDTKKLISKQDPGRRPIFGTDDRADIIDKDALKTAINNKGTYLSGRVPEYDSQIIAWVDDRHNYTGTDPNFNAYLLPNMGLEDYHPRANPGDGKQAADDAATCRPWIPLEVTIPLMKKADSLQTADPAIPEVTESMRNATGPIRVDWTFRDLAPEYKVDPAEYDATRVRSLAYITAALNNMRGVHNGKNACNLTKALGGIREGTYFELAYGIDAESLMPWKAEKDTGVSAVCSVAHDDLGQDEDRLFADRRGKAGVYFHPSIIGGDGYQCRAQLSFRDMPTAPTHPNWKVLKNRYDSTTLAQAHTAPIRLWRKDSYRAHIKWTETAGNWGSHEVANKKFYEPGMVHFVYEKENGNDFTATDFYGFFRRGAYRDLISAFVAGGQGADPKTMRYRASSEITVSDDTIWPWSTAKHLGVQGVPPPATTLANYRTAYQNQILNDTWRNFREPLVYDLLAKIERDKGILRGHMVGEFRNSPEYWLEQYRCNTCNTDQILMELEATGGSGEYEGCRAAVCAGVLHSKTIENYTCNKCNFHVTQKSISLKLAGSNCTAPCTGTMTGASQAASWFTRKMSGQDAVSTTYTCTVCGRQNSVTETTGTAGSRTGSACGQICPRGGKMTVDPGSRTVQQISAASARIGLPSWGGTLGGLFLDTTTGPRTYWSHEIGHHKHLTHAGDVITGPTIVQHDQSTNPAIVDARGAKYKKWDRDCIMSYINTEAGPDAAYFCGKCILRLRGWKVEGLADPASNVGGP
ncbi:MAG TPA: peptidoglycan-binding domain-containing protein, partial [Bryobacteraceae bacterium]